MGQPHLEGFRNPIWSPDGTKILFIAAKFLQTKFKFDLATMNPDGSGRRYVMPQEFQPYPKVGGTERFEEHQPDWESIP